MQYTVRRLPTESHLLSVLSNERWLPAQTNKEQRLQLQRVVEYGKSQNITVKITEIE